MKKSASCLQIYLANLSIIIGCLELCLAGQFFEFAKKPNSIPNILIRHSGSAVRYDEGVTVDKGRRTVPDLRQSILYVFDYSMAFQIFHQSGYFPLSFKNQLVLYSLFASSKSLSDEFKIFINKVMKGKICRENFFQIFNCKFFNR